MAERSDGPKPMSESMNAPPQFGRYQVKRVLGQGQMGTVYLAEDPLIGRPDARTLRSITTM